MKTLLVNSQLADITPAEPVFLSGYANRSGLSTGVHRPLSTRCVVLMVGARRMCLIVNDLVDIIPEMTQKLIASLVDRTGIAAGEVYVHAIHTHSAPIMEYGFSPANDRYIAWAMDRIVTNAAQTIAATGNYQPCSVWIGRSYCDISASRRLVDPQTGTAIKTANLAGRIDREAGIIQFVKRNGMPVVSVLNFACHPVVLGFESRVISTDYPGAARETVEKAYGGMAVFLNGAAGDINPILTDQTDALAADREGTKLGLAVTNAGLEIWSGDPELRIQKQTVYLPYRDQNMTAQQFDREVERRLDEQTEFLNWRTDLRKWRDMMIARLTKGNLPNSCSIEVAAARVGPVAFVLSQGEVFNAYQMGAKTSFPADRIFFAGYTNGASGYIPTAEAFRYGGYEVDQAYVYSEEPSPLTPETERLYTEAVNALISAVR